MFSLFLQLTPRLSSYDATGLAMKPRKHQRSIATVWHRNS